ncbi:MAG: long-chain-fatty-acid--CoA ligase [Desulfatibacillaceae bacterium]
MHKPWLRHYDSWVPETIEYPTQPLYTLFRNAALANSDKTALVFFDQEITYGQLLDWTDRFAAALAAAGIATGDRIVLSLPNCPQFPVAYYALQKLGAVVVMLNPLSVPREIEYKCRNSRARGLIALDMFAEQFLPVADKTGLDLVVFANILGLLPSGTAPTSVDKEGIRDFSEMATWREAHGPHNEGGMDDLAVIIYTGGTTGDPKGAMLSHLNIITNSWSIAGWFGIRPDDRGLAVLPFFHGFGMQVMLNTHLLFGASLVVMPRFDIEDLLNLVHKHHPTVMVGVPTIFVAVNNHPERSNYDFSSVRCAVSGGAPLPLSVKHAFEDFTGGKLLEGYGLTESTCAVCANPYQGLYKEGTIGIPMPDVDMKIVDLDTGTKDMPVGESGEIIIKSPTVMIGYYGNATATKENIRDGWLYSGDIGAMDEDGYFTILDRKKEMIIASGFNIYPKEVENILCGHPAVSEAAVIGVPDSYRGETVKAFITMAPGAEVSEEEITAFCRENMLRYMVPAEIEFRNELPKTPIGKILKKELKAEELARMETVPPA